MTTKTIVQSWNRKLHYGTKGYGRVSCGAGKSGMRHFNALATQEMIDSADASCFCKKCFGDNIDKSKLTI